MNTLHRKDFANLCDIANRTIPTQVKRNKILMVNDEIDLDNPINKQFLETRYTYLATENKPIPPTLTQWIIINKPKLINEKATATPPPATPPATKSATSKNTQPKKQSTPATTQPAVNTPSDSPPATLNTEDLEALSLPDLKEEQLRAMITKLREDGELARLKKEKLLGQMVPTDLIKIVFSQFSHTMASAYKQAIDNAIIELTASLKLSSAEGANLRSQLLQNVNRANKNGIKAATQQLNTIVQNHTETRTVGEHD